MKTKGRRTSKNLRDFRDDKSARRHRTEMALELATRARLSGKGEADRATDDLNAHTAKMIRRGSIWKRMQAPADHVPAHASKFSGKAIAPKKKQPSRNGTPDTVPVPPARPKATPTSTQVTPGKWETMRKKYGETYREFLSEDKRKNHGK